MPNDIARGTIVGRLTRDAELNESGKVAQLGLAVNRRVKRDDEWQDEVSFLDAKLLGNRASALAPYLTKGKQVAVDCRIVQERWTNAEGQNRSAVRFIVDDLVLCGGRDDAPAEASESSAPAPSGPKPGDDIPF